MNVRFKTLVLLGALALSSCATPPPVSEDPFALDADLISPDGPPPVKVDELPPVPFVGLRDLAAARGLDLGVAIAYRPLSTGAYANLAASEFNTVTPENDMKWEVIHHTAEHYEWFSGDLVVKFAQDHHMKLRGHTLVWHNQLGTWVTKDATTKQQLLDIVKDHVSTVVSHYKGQLAKWDVVNEVIDDKSGMRPSVFYNLAGTDFIDLAFRTAHAADPDCLLYINDYNVEDVNPKSDRLYELVKGLVARGVPINGVGLQAHWILDQMPSMASVRQNVARFVALGLKVDFTELDIRYPGPPTPERQVQQAAAYRDLMQLVLTTDGTDSVTLWGLDDGHSWIPAMFSSFGNALLIDKQYHAKPAYEALAKTLSTK